MWRIYKWLPEAPAVRWGRVQKDCLHTGDLEDPGKKVKGLELTMESCESGAGEGRPKVTAKTGAPPMRQKWDFLHSLFIPPIQQAYWLVPPTPRVALPTSVVCPADTPRTVLSHPCGYLLLESTAWLAVTPSTLSAEFSWGFFAFCHLFSLASFTVVY